MNADSPNGWWVHVCMQKAYPYPLTFSPGTCHHKAFVMGRLLSKGAGNKKAPDWLFIEMEICTDDGLQ